MLTFLVHFFKMVRPNFLGNKHLDDEDEDDDLSDNNVGSILDEDSAIVHVEGENFLLFM